MAAAKEKMDIKLKKCTPPEFRASFANVHKAKSAFEGQEEKFSVVMLFPKKGSLKDLERCYVNAGTEMWGPDKTKWPKNLVKPFKDGDEKTQWEGYAGHIAVTASSKQRPGIVDNELNDLISPEDFYSGCYARATVIAFAWTKMGKNGISFSLQNLQKLRDGKQFSGRKKASEEFERVENTSDSPDSYGDSDQAASDFG